MCWAVFKAAGAKQVSMDMFLPDYYKEKVDTTSDSADINEIAQMFGAKMKRRDKNG